MGTTITTMEITTTMGMVGTMGVPTRDFRHAALMSMTEREARGREAAIGMTWNDFKALLVEEFCPSNEMKRLENEFWNRKMVGANHAAYTDRFHKLAKLVPHLVTPESVRIKRYLAGLVPEIRGMLKVTQSTTIQDAILRAGILTDKAISCDTLSKSNEKRKAVEETGKSGGSWRDKKKAKMGAGFVATTPPKNEFRPSYFAKHSRAPFKRATPVNAVKMEFELGTRYECGSREHFRNTYPKLNRAPGQDPKVVTGIFSFDSGAVFISFISTEFAPLLNVKPSIVNPGYVIEVGDGKKVEVDRIIRDCKLELGNSLFSINLIPLGHRSFNVIVGMDWLSQNKVVIVFHEKVVEIPLEGDSSNSIHLYSNPNTDPDRMPLTKAKGHYIAFCSLWDFASLLCAEARGFNLERTLQVIELQERLLFPRGQICLLDQSFIWGLRLTGFSDLSFLRYLGLA
ncbi:putative reverse transcriptase domain-containing protein [Tanacetum coccineum]